jgi:hypothetical protein
MRGVLFLGRVAFICNLFFALCLLIRHTHFTVPQGFTEFIVITGWIMSIFLNIIFAFFVTIFIKKKETGVPVWLIAFNIFWLTLQIFYFLLMTQ